jgi:transcriptional regulator with XRE-family HTH domain
MRTRKPPDGLDRLIGRNIRFFRIEGGLSQTELAEHIGVTFQQLQKYENAANRVPASRLIRIARVLNVPVPILWSDHEDAAASELASRIPGVPEARRRLTRAVSSISDPQLLKVIAELAEALAKVRVHK